MSICTPAIICQIAPACVDTLFIGTIEDVDTNVSVQFYNSTTGRRTLYPGSSDNAGLVSVGIDDCQMIAGHAYRITVHPENVLDTRLELMIGSKTGDELSVIFGDIYDYSGAVATFSEYTLVAE